MIGRLKTVTAAVLLAAALYGNAASATALAELLKSNAASGRVDVAKVDALYDEAILGNGGIDLAVRRLQVFARSSNRPDGERVNNHLAIAHLYWRYGNRDRALASIDDALAILETADGLLLKARIVDATGDAAAAVPWYRRAKAATGNPGEQAFIGLRLAMIEVSERNVDALVALAGGRDQAFRNRSAVALAVLGRPDRAIELYRPEPSGERAFQQQIRRAEWAIAAGDLAAAREAAWTAYENASTRLDALYGLAVIVEAYRKDDELQRLIDKLDGFGDLNDDLLRTRVDLLIETEQYGKAIDFYRGLDGGGLDGQSRQRLIDLYEAAGHTSEMVAEYRRLMESEPGTVRWYAALAGHYMEAAQAERALAVWERLEADNADSLPVLVDAAGSMLDMGFVAEATQMIERHLAGHGESATGLTFLFETHLTRGQEAQALAVLQRLEAILPPGSSEVRAVADGYERLQRYSEAVRVYERLQESEGRLGYDQLMRLAWLYGLAGDKQKALEIWQAIWVGVDSPARRSFAESQLLQLAAELNGLADIVVDLEDKLYRRKADKNDIQLLVRIYTEVGDAFSATEAVEEYARYSGGSEIDRLNQLGRVYLQLSEHSKYDEILRRLEQIDTGNRVEHIQNIVLNMLAFDLADGSGDPFREQEIQHWLGELREYDAGGVSGEFEASILSMAGFNDRAIQSYRRALAERPAHSDNLLLMADLMNSSGRTGEAVSLLQYVAEHAADDNAFVVAVDGIINMIGQRRFGEALTPESRRLFRWTHRIILERITGRDDKFYLYTLLAEIAAETNDVDAEYAAIESSLSQAGVRRASILRELVTMSTPGAGFSGGNKGDSDRQVTYARRLIGLRQQLPPEVYISVGRTLLERGDTQAAEKAFNMINDITGTIDVDETKANLFRHAGYRDRALSYYSRALSVNRDDLELLLRTAVLRESEGRDDVANDWYFRALSKLLSSQPAVLQNDEPERPSDPFAAFQSEADVSVNRDYRTYYESLVQGFLITWPREPASAKLRVGAIRQWFDTELENVIAASGDEGRLVLARYPRLDRMARFMRRIARTVNEPELGEHADLELLRYFQEDSDYRNTIAGEYRAWGQADFANTIEATGSSPGAAPAPRLSLRSALAAAKNGGETEIAIKLSRIAGDERGLLQICRGLIADGKYREGLGHARSALGDSEYRRFVSTITPTLKDGKAAFIRLLIEDPELVAHIEALTGRELIAAGELLILMRSPEVQSYLAESFGGQVPVWEYFTAKASVDDQLRFARQIAERSDGGRFSVFYDMGTIVKHLFARALTPMQKREVSNIVLEYLSRQDFKNESTRMNALSVLLVLDAHADNVDVLEELIDAWKLRAQSGIDPKPLIRARFDDSTDEAFEVLLDLHRAGLLGKELWTLRNLVTAFFEEEYARVLEDLQEGEIIDPVTARTLYELQFGNLLRFGRDDSMETAKAMKLLESLIESYPDDNRYRLESIHFSQRLGDRAGTERALSDYYAYDPADDNVRAAYFIGLVADEKYAAAEAVATDGGPDLRDEAVMAALTAKLGQDARFAPATGAGILFKALGNVGRQPPNSLLDSLQRDVERLRASLVESDDEQSRLALRAVWREALVGAATSGWGGANMHLADRLLAAPLDTDDGAAGPWYSGRPADADNRYTSFTALIESGEGAEPELLFGAIAATRFGATELESYLASMPDGKRRSFAKMYEIVADAYAAGSPDGKRLKELDAALESGSIGDHEFTLWMLLRDRAGDGLDVRELQAFRERETGSGNPTDLQLLAAARLYARSDAVRESVERYQLLAASQLQYGEFRDDRQAYAGPGEQIVVTVLELIDDAVSRLPQEEALRLTKSVLAVAARADDEPAYRHLHEALVLAALGKLLPAAEVLAATTEFSAVSVEQTEVPKIAESIRLHALSGDYAKAFGALRLLLAVPESRKTDGDDRVSGRAVQHRYQVLRNAHELSRLYGFQSFGNRIGADAVSSLPLLIKDRKRLFSAWYREAANSILGNLDSDGLNKDRALGVVFAIAYQLHQDGRDEAARDIVSRAADRVSDNRTDVGVSGLRDLVAMMLYLEVEIPVDIAREILEQGSLTVAQEIALIAALAKSSGAGTALDAGLFAVEGSGKLSLLKELKILADIAGESDHAADLERRIGEAEDARSRIDAALLQAARRGSA